MQITLEHISIYEMKKRCYISLKKLLTEKNMILPLASTSLYIRVYV